MMISIRPALPEDDKQVASLIYLSHTESFKPFASSEWVESRDLAEYQEKWKEVLLEPDAESRTWVAVENESIIGTARVATMPATSRFDAQLTGMHVLPGRTGDGIGSKLMRVAQRFMTEQGHRIAQLGVIASNEGTRRFYERHGWTLDQEYDDGIEGVPIVTYKYELNQ